MHSDPQLPECVFPPPLFKPVSSQQAPQVSRRQDGGQPLGRQGWRSRQLLSPSQGHSHATHNTHTRAKTREDRLTRPGVCGNPLLQSGAGVAHSQCPGTSLQQHLLENLEQDDLIGLYPRGFSHRRSNTPHGKAVAQFQNLAPRERSYKIPCVCKGALFWTDTNRKRGQVALLTVRARL
ncbi:uncharacterized protein [Macaca nemestrina]|uniref:uncharacterized protein isoform X3 n=1 Tax=Macaca nemestrina TaxID=9545 RepID=UPI0039B8EA95